MDARIWYRQGRLEDAISEASRAIEAFEKVGATVWLAGGRILLRDIQEARNRATSRGSNSNGMLLEAQSSTFVDPSPQHVGHRGAVPRIPIF